MKVLFFSRGERLGILVLFILIIFFCFTSFYYTSLNHPPSSPLPPSPMLQKFDPNTLDSIDFIQYGLKPYLVRNIIKYRKAGGIFKNAQSLTRIYGMDSLNYKKIESFIDIPIPEKKPIVKIELNQADSIQLVSIKGIGPVFASRIIRFRNNLGGFYATAQLAEVYGMKADFLAHIYTQTKVNASSIERIKINCATFSILNRHPYISYAQAGALIRLRSINRICKWKEILELDEFTHKDERLKNYISFDI